MNRIDILTLTLGFVLTTFLAIIVSNNHEHDLIKKINEMDSKLLQIKVELEKLSQIQFELKKLETSRVTDAAEIKKRFDNLEKFVAPEKGKTLKEIIRMFFGSDEKDRLILPEPSEPVPKLLDVTPQPPYDGQPQQHVDEGNRTPEIIPILLSGSGSIHWVQTSGGNVPPDAVQGGHDRSGPIYVGRLKHACDLLPGKLVSSHNVVYASYFGKEERSCWYEVLVAPPNSVKWISSCCGQVPSNAIPGGSTATGETLYIGRSHYDGTITIGKIHRSHGKLYISYGGKEIGFKEYEVLVSN